MRNVIFRRILSATLALLLLISFPSYTSAAGGSLDSADTWAHEGIRQALDKGFIPNDLQNNYRNVITRAEFCRMAVKFAEYATGKTIDEILREKNLTRRHDAFRDTKDADILAAFALGITSGTVAPTATAPGTFTPDGEFNRQQAATMIMNLCKAIGMTTDNPPVSDFVDLNSADVWARAGINFVRANGIMGGTGTTVPTFSPMQAYTRQQSIITLNNIKVAVTKPESAKPASLTLPEPKSFTSAAEGLAGLNLDFLKKTIEMPSGVTSGPLGDRIDDLIKFQNAIDPAYFLSVSVIDENKKRKLPSFSVSEGKNFISIALVKIPPNVTNFLTLFELSLNESAADRAAKEIEINVKFTDAANAEAVRQLQKIFGGVGDVYLDSGATAKDFNNRYVEFFKEGESANRNKELIAAYSVSVMLLNSDAINRVGAMFYENAPRPADIVPDNTPVKSGRYIYATVVQDKANPANTAYRYNLVNLTVELTRDEKLLSLYPDTKKTLNVSGGKYSDSELARAVESGFGVTQSVESYITFTDFMKMLDKTVELADKSKLAAWQKQFPEARKSDGIITRLEAMILVTQCAGTLGDTYTKFNYEGDLSKSIRSAQGGYNDDLFWNSVDTGVGIIDYLENLPIINAKFADGHESHPWVYIEYALGRVSLVSKKPLFEYDINKEVPLRPGEPLTYTEGLLAALRLYESVPR